MKGHILCLRAGFAPGRGGGGLCRQDGPPNGQGWKVTGKAGFVHGSPPAPFVCVGSHFKRDHVCICFHFSEGKVRLRIQHPKLLCFDKAENIETSQYGLRGQGETSLGKRLGSKEGKKKRGQTRFAFQDRCGSERIISTPLPGALHACPRFSTHLQRKSGKGQ